MADRFNSVIQADRRSPLKRFWDEEVMWRARALYHNDALNLPVQLLTGSRMDEPATPEKVAVAAMSMAPIGRLATFGRSARVAESMSRAERAFNVSGSAKKSAEVLMGPRARVGRAVGDAVGRVKGAYRDAGVLGAAGSVVKSVAKTNQAIGHSLSRVFMRDLGMKAAPVNSVVKVSGPYAKTVAANPSTFFTKEAGMLRGAADFATSPLGVWMEYMYATRDERQARHDQAETKKNTEVGRRIETAQAQNDDIALALAARSDKAVLAAALGRRIDTFEEAKKTRYDRAAAQANRERGKGDFDRDAAIARASAALADITKADEAALLEGIDRSSDAWKDLRRQRLAEAMRGDAFVQKYGVDYEGLDSMIHSRDTNVVNRANAIIDEFKTTVPTNGVREVYFMGGRGM